MRFKLLHRNAAGSRRPWSRWLSWLSLLLFSLLFVFVEPLCDSPTYYVILGALPIIAVLCGPFVYRLFGVVAIGLSVWMAIGQSHVRKERQAMFERLQEQVRHEQSEKKKK